jgi:predicted phage terminase large subunit-like protein
MADLKTKISGMVPSEPMGSKETRAHAASGDVEAGNVFLPGPYDGEDRVDRSFVHDFIEECANFPNDSHDDQVDAFTQAVLHFNNAPAPLDTPAPGGVKKRSDFRNH